MESRYCWIRTNEQSCIVLAGSDGRGKVVLFEFAQKIIIHRVYEFVVENKCYVMLVGPRELKCDGEGELFLSEVDADWDRQQEAFEETHLYCIVWDWYNL